MRVCNVGDNRSAARPLVLGQQSGPGYSNPKEVVFRIIDENGNETIIPGKKRLQYQIDGLTFGRSTQTGWADSYQVNDQKGYAKIQVESPWGNPIPGGGYNPGAPVTGTLSLWTSYNGVIYPIFQGRAFSFTPAPGNPQELDLRAIYGEIVKKNEAAAEAVKAAAAAKYAADTAALDEEMYQSYQNGLATEAQAASAAEKARVAAEAAAVQKQISDDAAKAAAKAAQDAEDARAKAAGEVSARNKTLMWAAGGLAALGLVSYMAFSGK